jgi:hypothetical protein
MSYGNNNNQGPKQEKLWASSAKKWLHFNNETDPATGRARKEQGAFDFEVTEEVSFSIKPQDVAELVGRIQDAGSQPGWHGRSAYQFVLPSSNLAAKPRVRRHRHPDL